MEETLKSLADLPQLIREQSQEQNNSEQEPEQEQNQQEQNNKPLSKYAAKQQRRRSLAEGPLEQHHHNQQQHEVRRSANLQDTEKWMAIVRLATSLDQISSKVENLENRLNALVVPEAQPPMDVEALRKDLWDDFAKHAKSIVQLITVRLEEQVQDLRYRQKAIQTQITNDVTGAHERINARLSDLVTDVCDTRDLLRELMRRVGDPADTPISSRLREVQYLTKQLELQKEQKEQEDQKEEAPWACRKHWLPRWACQILFGSDRVHVTDHGVWTEMEIQLGAPMEFDGVSLWDLYKKIRSARRAYKVQQKIQKLQEQLNQNTAAK